MRKVPEKAIDIARTVHDTLPERIHGLLQQEADPEKRDNLLRVERLLNQAKKSKKLKGLQNNFIQLALAFYQANQEIAEEDLFIELLLNRFQNDGKINCVFNGLARREASYADIYHALSQQGKRPGQPVPESLKNNSLAAQPISPGQEPEFSGWNVDHNIFIKIRDFISFEITDAERLNKTAAILSLLYPDHKDFVSFVKKYGAYDHQNQTLGLVNLIDVSKFNFTTADYSGWGKALIEAPKSTLFYFYCHDLLDCLPKNNLGKILTGEIDRVLFNKIGDVGGRFTDDELRLYSDLDVARDLLAERKFKRDNADKVKNKKDEVIGVPDIKIDGACVGLAGYTFGRPSFDDQRYLHLGRYFGTCEHLTGHWGQTLKDSWVDRTSYFLAAFGPDRVLVGGSRIRRGPSNEDPIFGEVVFDGPESYHPLITDDIWDKIVETAKNQFPDEIFKIAPSQSYKNLRVDVSRINPAEARRGHNKTTEDDYLDLRQVVEQAGFAPVHIDAQSVPNVTHPKPF